jgi:predicted N-acetyltransferase YhbS
MSAYYRRFGYEPLSGYPITLPFEAPPQDCMILNLARRSLAGVHGQVRYAAEWLDH